jgi:hypothetical protein
VWDYQLVYIMITTYIWLLQNCKENKRLESCRVLDELVEDLNMFFCLEYNICVYMLMCTMPRIILA